MAKLTGSPFAFLIIYQNIYSDDSSWTKTKVWGVEFFFLLGDNFIIVLLVTPLLFFNFDLNCLRSSGMVSEIPGLTELLNCGFLYLQWTWEPYEYVFNVFRTPYKIIFAFSTASNIFDFILERVWICCFMKMHDTQDRIYWSLIKQIYVQNTHLYKKEHYVVSYRVHNTRDEICISTSYEIWI